MIELSPKAMSGLTIIQRPGNMGYRCIFETYMVEQEKVVRVEGTFGSRRCDNC
jgi:hypothetical protein